MQAILQILPIWVIWHPEGPSAPSTALRLGSVSPQPSPGERGAQSAAILQGKAACLPGSRAAARCRTLWWRRGAVGLCGTLASGGASSTLGHFCGAEVRLEARRHG